MAAAIACVAGPASAYSGAAAGGSFTAIDFAWQANGTSDTTLTVTPGQTVTFAYPSGTSFHNVVFTGKQPASCTGLTAYARPKGWSGECAFEAAGRYPFTCIIHDTMTGEVVVAAAPEPTATATPTATADPIATPGATPAAGATPEPAKPTQATLAVKLASTQRGNRVRGWVNVTEKASRLDVTVTAGSAKAGTYLKKSTPAGAVAFSVSLDARARRLLERRHQLRVTVAVALTPPGGRKLVQHAKVTLRPG